MRALCSAQVLAERAAQMRAAPTSSEARLWLRLRANQLGTPFRRQVVVGGFIVDFLAPAARLVVEVDGAAYHARRARAYERRDRKLRRLGIACFGWTRGLSSSVVLRFPPRGARKAETYDAPRAPRFLRFSTALKNRSIAAMAPVALP